MKGVRVARRAAGAAWPLLVLLLVAAASVHADATAAPARRLLADGATVQPQAEAPPLSQVSVSKAAGLSCGTSDPNISCPPAQAP